MASSKQQILSIYGAFYLPLALLTGLTLSVILPAGLRFLIPAMNSALFISLPHLCNAFLSWVTPPCLFVLLNGIIFVLTASSGVLSSSKSGSGSDFHANLLGKMENLQTASSGTLVADSSASDSYTNLLPKMEDVQKQCSAAVMVDTVSSEVVIHTCSARVEAYPYLPASSRAMLCARTPSVFHDVHGVLETERSKIFGKEENDGDDENPSNLSRRAMESTSFSQEEEEEEEEEEDNDERLSGLPKLDVVNKSFSIGSRSEPSSPQFAMPSRSNMITRSLSVDSASLHDNQASSGCPEDLSDEAFRKMIEDFIFKKNAQLRNEAK